jgi:hypothetical protein
MLGREATNTNFIVFGMTRQRLEPMIYCTQLEHANPYLLIWFITQAWWSSTKRFSLSCHQIFLTILQLKKLHTWRKTTITKSTYTRPKTTGVEQAQKCVRVKPDNEIPTIYYRSSNVIIFFTEITGPK